MREIKFRTWNTDDKRMEYGDGLFKFTGVIHELVDYIKSPAIHGTKIGRMFNGKLMQFTGLKDKNGVEIYEGDIYHQGDVSIKYIVQWHDCGLKGKQIGSSSYAGIEHWQDRIEVIGNVHEHPELLTK